MTRLAFDGYEVALHGYISTKESAFSVKKRKRGGVDFYGGRLLSGSIKIFSAEFQGIGYHLHGRGGL